MLLVEQGVLWVLPMLWLVLLLSEEAGAATATTGSRLLGEPGGAGRGGGQGPSQGSPLPQRLHRASPGGGRGALSTRLLLGPGILTCVRVDVPESSGEQSPNKEGTKGNTQHSGQDEAFTCVTKGGITMVNQRCYSTLSPALPLPCPAGQEHRF
jgi:hypothetical protein